MRRLMFCAAKHLRWKMDAIVTAGGRIAGSFAAQEGVTIKALLRLNGQTLLERTLAAVRRSRHVDRLCVVGPWELEALAKNAGADLFVDEGITGIDNLIAAARALHARGPVLCSASDLPFIRPEDVDTVIELSPSEAAVSYSIIRREEWEAMFPGAHAMFVPLSDGVFTGGCIHIIDADALQRMEALLQRAFSARKSQTGMARLLGVGLTMRLLAGRHLHPRLAPSTEAARRRAETLVGCRCAIVHGCSPRIAADVDDLEDWLYVRGNADRLANGAG
jgi:GTP:adenosylcobinamide-phosphate guanylyltransferase